METSEKEFSETDIPEGEFTDMGATKAVEDTPKRPHVNFRPLLFCALGAAFGTFLYSKIRFGGLVPSDFLFLALLLPLCLLPFTKKRVLIFLLLFSLFAGGTSFGLHIYTQNFLSGPADTKEYSVQGTVTLIAVRNGYTSAELGDLTLDGIHFPGKLRVSLPSEDIRPGDRVSFTSPLAHTSLPIGVSDSYDFVNNIRFSASADSFECLDPSDNLLLRLNAHLYDTLHAHMPREEANISYALLTGNSRMVDDGFMDAVRIGGIAHIFAVSGLHIGILYGAACLLFFPLKRYAFLPALVLAILYSALCGFTVSSLRALVICIALSVNTFLHRKNDLLSSTSLAAVFVLLFFPAEWLSVGFRLSFGACIGLALFSGSLSRGLRRIHIPRFFSDLISASLSVQLFTFPIVMEAFGYFSVWGLLLNLIFVPLLPAAFLALLLCILLSLCIPPAAGFFLLFPEGVFSLLLYLFAVSDFGYVLSGFLIGAGAMVWLCATVFLSERIRLSRGWKCFTALSAVLLFSLSIFVGNSCFGGVTVDVTSDGLGTFALIETPHETILVLDENSTLSGAQDFLLRRTNKPDVAIVLGDDCMQGINIAAFTGADILYVRARTDTGLHETNVVFGEKFTVGNLRFRYETRRRILMMTDGFVVCFDFSDATPTPADLDILPSQNAKFLLTSDCILKIR